MLPVDINDGSSHTHVSLHSDEEWDTFPHVVLTGTTTGSIRISTHSAHLPLMQGHYARSLPFCPT
jgi:hypothetical protein